jgi:hypothetical protein
MLSSISLCSSLLRVSPCTPCHSCIIQLLRYVSVDQSNFTFSSPSLCVGSFAMDVITRFFFPLPHLPCHPTTFTLTIPSTHTAFLFSTLGRRCTSRCGSLSFSRRGLGRFGFVKRVALLFTSSGICSFLCLIHLLSFVVEYGRGRLGILPSSFHLSFWTQLSMHLFQIAIVVLSHLVSYR